MFCLSLCNLPQTHRFDGSCPPMFSGSWGSHWLIPPQTIPSGSGTGDVVLSFCSESLAVTRGCKIRTAIFHKAVHVAEQSFVFINVADVLHLLPFITIEICSHFCPQMWSCQVSLQLLLDSYSDSHHFVGWHTNRAICLCNAYIVRYVNSQKSQKCVFFRLLAVLRTGLCTATIKSILLHRKLSLFIFSVCTCSMFNFRLSYIKIIFEIYKVSLNLLCLIKGGKSNRSGRWGTWQCADSESFCNGGAGDPVSEDIFLCATPTVKNMGCCVKHK